MKKLALVMIFIFSFISCEQVITGGIREPGSTDDPFVDPTDPITQARIEALENATSVSEPTVEIRHLVEPKVDEQTAGGAYLKKLTIPRDYKGQLYLAGINLSSLNGKNVKVRFNFGVGGSFSKTIDASIGNAPGLTDNSSITVLVMDFRQRPFSQVVLPYDLYDYNDYTFDGSSDATAIDSAIGYNRDTKLYCRGLSLEDDPTFTGNIANGCQNQNDVCKYAYASVEDQGLNYTTDSGVEVALNPSRQNIMSEGNGYYQDSDTQKLMRCLPDNPELQQMITGSLFTYDDFNQFSLAIARSIQGVDYTYRGPYRVTALDQWQIVPDSDASRNTYGLFSSQVFLGLEYYMYGSKMFPRYIKRNLSAGDEYLGSAIPNEAKTVLTMPGDGASEWMDGCNARATTRVNGEHIGSCTVTGTIEVFYIDNGIEKQVDLAKDVKLQIVKETNYESVEDVLSGGFEACSSTSECGSTECCIKNRCWDKSIVSSCVEDEPSYGNQLPGSQCQNDYQCASLCCNGGTCGSHNTDQSPPAYCSKPIGQSCVAKEWCAQQPVTRCFIVKTVIDSQGAQQCALRCYTNLENGECANGTCQGPVQPQVPVFDPNDPNRCVDACDPPDFSSGVFNINCGN